MKRKTFKLFQRIYETKTGREIAFFFNEAAAFNLNALFQKNSFSKRINLDLNWIWQDIFTTRLCLDIFQSK
jgi:hypothetical protein